MSGLLTPDQVAAALQVPRRAVLGMHRAGRLHGVRLGRRIRFHPDDLEDFLARKEQQHG